MHLFKKILIAFVSIIAVIGVLLGSAYFLARQQQDTIFRQIFLRVNAELPGTFIIHDAEIRLFAQFPYLSLELRDMRFYPTKDTTSQPVYAMQRVYLGFSIFDLWQKNYRLKRLTLEGGELNLVRYSDGALNLLQAKGLDAAKDTAASGSSQSLTFDIERLTIRGVRVAYRDEKTFQEILTGIENAEMNFSLQENIIRAGLKTAFLLDIKQNGASTFFRNKHICLQTTAEYNQTSGDAVLRETLFDIEKASFGIEGKINTKDSMYADIRFQGQKPSLTTFAAFAPPTLAETLERYKNSGNISFEGKLNGWLLGENLPAFRVDFRCENAAVVNTDVNRKVEAINFVGSLTNGNPHRDSTHGWKYGEFRLLNVRAKPEVGIFRGNIVIRNFEDPYVNVGVNADLDLEFLAQFLGIAGLKRLRGQVMVDMNLNELVDIEKPDETLLRLKEGIQSELTIKNLAVDVPGFPQPITDINGHAIMREGTITLDDLSFRIADSDIHFDGTFSDIPAVFHAQDKPITATLNAKSNRLNIRQILAFDSTLASKTDEEITNLDLRCEFQTRANELRTFSTLPKGEFFIHNISARFKGYPHHLHDVRADVVIDKKKISVKDVSGVVDGSDIHLTAEVENYEKWLQPVKRGESSVRLAVRSQYFSLKDILSYNGRNFVPAQYRDEELRNFSLDASLTTRFDSVLREASVRIGNMSGAFKLHNMNLRNADGIVHYEKGKVTLEALNLSVGKSDISMKGTFSLDSARRVQLQSSPGAMPILLELRSKNLDVDELFTLKKNAVSIARGTKKQSATPAQILAATTFSSSDSLRHASAFNIFRVPFPDAEIRLSAQAMKYKNMKLNSVVANLRTQADHQCFLDTIVVGVAGGVLGMSGNLKAVESKNGSGDIVLKADISARNVDISKLLLKFDNFGQDRLMSENLTGILTGRINADLALHPDVTPIMQKSTADIDIQVKNGELLNFAPIQAMTRFFRAKNLNRIRFDTLRNSLTLQNGTLIIPTMTIASSLGFIELKGEQSIQRSGGFAMNYTIGVPLSQVAETAWGALFGSGGTQKQDSLPTDRIDAIRYRPPGCKEILVKMRIQGKPGEYRISPGW